MTGIFKANNPYNNFLLFVYALVLKLHLFYGDYPPLLGKNDGIFYTKIVQFLQSAAVHFSSLFGVLSFVLLLGQAIAINGIVRNLRLTTKPHYLAGMAYLLITSLFPAWFSFSAALLSTSFVVWCWSKLSLLYNSSKPLSTIFNIGFVLALSAFIYLPSAIFLLVCFSALAMYRSFKAREWLMILVGVATPFYFYFSYLFLADQLSAFSWPRVTIGLIKLKPPLVYLATIALMIITALIGLYYVNRNFSKQVVTSRKNWQVILLYLFYFCALIFFPSFDKINFPFMLAAPFAILHSAAFYYLPRKWMTFVLHFALLGIAIYLGYFSSFCIK